jgi:hypothetical protein
MRRTVIEKDTKEELKAGEYIMSLDSTNPDLFTKENSNFKITGDEAKLVTIELLNQYVSGCRGQLNIDSDHQNIYWLDVWINGNFLTRTLKLSDYIRIKIDTEKVIQITGTLEDFEIYFSNEATLRCNKSITLS